MFIASLTHDLIKGLIFLHSTDIGAHGNLRSSNCVVTSRYEIQVFEGFFLFFIIICVVMMVVIIILRKVDPSSH